MNVDALIREAHARVMASVERRLAPHRGNSGKVLTFHRRSLAAKFRKDRRVA